MKCSKRKEENGTNIWLPTFMKLTQCTYINTFNNLDINKEVSSKKKKVPQQLKGMARQM